MRIKKTKNKKYLRIRDISLSSFFLVFLAIASFIASIFVSNNSFANIVSSSSELNPFLKLFKDFNLFVSETNNIIFLVLILFSLVLLYLGFLLLPTINIILSTKEEEKSLIKYACFGSPLVFVWLMFFPIVWFVCQIILMAKASKYASLNIDDFDFKNNPVNKNSSNVKNVSHPMPEDASAPVSNIPNSVLQPEQEFNKQVNNVYNRPNNNVVQNPYANRPINNMGQNPYANRPINNMGQNPYANRPMPQQTVYNQNQRVMGNPGYYTNPNNVPRSMGQQPQKPQQ